MCDGKGSIDMRRCEVDGSIVNLETGIRVAEGLRVV